MNHDVVYGWLYVHKTREGLTKVAEANRRWGRGEGKVWMKSWDEYPLTVPVDNRNLKIPARRPDPVPVQQEYEDYNPNAYDEYAGGAQ